MKGGSFLLGYAFVEGAESELEAVLNICYENSIHFHSVEALEEGFTLCVALYHLKRLKKLAKERKIELSVLSMRGLPALLWRHRRRIGIPIGLALSLALFIFASGRIWDIRVEGAINISERQVLFALERCGLTVGTKISDIDSDELENRALILSDEISWISVNIKENVAFVEIRELELAPSEENTPLYSNVVASRDGVIVSLENISGDISVKMGDAVSKGEVLISGISGGEGKPTRLMRAKGEVYAEVNEKIEIKIPRFYVKKITKKELCEEKYLIFFKNEIKFFSNSRNLTSTYDKIDIIENLYTAFGSKLPIAVRTVKLIEYEEVELELSQAEMREMALRELYWRIEEDFSDAEILSRSVDIELNENECTLRCSLTCVKNIAQINEIAIGG